MFYVYVLQSETGFYVGFSADLRQRLKSTTTVRTDPRVVETGVSFTTRRTYRAAQQ